MNTFLIPRKKVIELVILPVFLAILYLIYPSFEAMALFAFGYIWNWSASNDLSFLFLNKRYKFSFLKLVVGVQSAILKPFANAPEMVKRLIKVFPAGLFWLFVIYVNESQMPWWTTFLGSLAFELMQIEINFIKKQKGNL